MVHVSGCKHHGCTHACVSCTSFSEGAATIILLYAVVVQCGSVCLDDINYMYERAKPLVGRTCLIMILFAWSSCDSR